MSDQKTAPASALPIAAVNVTVKTTPSTGVIRLYQEGGKEVGSETVVNGTPQVRVSFASDEYVYWR